MGGAFSAWGLSHFLKWRWVKEVSFQQMQVK